MICIPTHHCVGSGHVQYIGLHRSLMIAFSAGPGNVQLVTVFQWRLVC